MSSISLDQANKIIDGAFSYARDNGLKPLSVVVLDARGSMKAAASADGTSMGRSQIAFGKAYGGLAFECNSRTLGAMATSRPHFIGALNGVFSGNLVPVPGGLTIVGQHGEAIGAVGVSGDTSDKDEAAALAGVASAGLVAASE
ncbi:heme-binding protein [Mesorhizobium sp. CA8]|uniref:GlcG/HbpS family heme-binding protein n=1 Tax=unclassified Mesorhizobium TaxID=325217 RepID=UPI001CC9D3CB|nr:MULTISPECIES: heme-binding protein [unclassified Mesorhizobium]MBZ9761688.1 heme-binding protein [Mesorhizobium sp. CA8]MBZ9820558.1 heme-binding protein [Mesorhizobium sp. CA4]